MRRYFFVFRFREFGELDMRCPTGGIVLHAWTRKGAVKAAWEIAERRFPRKPDELLWVVEVKDPDARDQAAIMDRDWERAFSKFHELMTVS